MKALFAGWIMLMPLALWAGEIKLQPEAQLEMTDGIPVAAIQISNLGNESVRIVSLEGRLQDQKTQSLPDQVLLPGGTFVAKMIFHDPLRQPAAPPAVIHIRYAHMTGQTFSSIVLAQFPPSDSNDSEWLSVRISQGEIGRAGKVSLDLLLIQDDPEEVSVKLIIPDEFSCESSERKVMLEPDIPRIETFQVVNLAAVPGAAYPIIALVERKQNGAGQYTSASGGVTVTKMNWIGQSGLFWGCVSIALLLLLGVLVGPKRGGQNSAPSLQASSLAFERVILILLGIFMIWHFAPSELIRNTTPVGGDTPAHLYLVSHLKEQLLQHGRIISWAGGWWCGFPMFQYYFVLPYGVAALLSILIPLNVAFKLVSVAGMVLTPFSAYFAARIWRFPGNIPVLMALAMVPFLFVQSHTMWGVNTASTLAGMIANSWSFALLLPALASGCRDITEGKFRLGTVLLFVLVLASHFFTSVIMFMTLAIVPVLAALLKRVSLSRGILVLAAESMLAFMLMGWWLVPLVAKSAFSMDFGVNWEVSLLKSFPAYSVGVVIFAGIALVAGLRRAMSPVWTLLWMFGVSVALFKFGFSLSPVFVNVRLWPFIFFALMALGVVGLGVLLNRIRRGWILAGLLVPVILVSVLLSDSVGGIRGPGLTRSWAKWNYGGLEDKPAAPVFAKLMPLLKGTPGRLANDLCEENNQLGSSRVFEIVPYLIGKPILEGGLVNSALGSMYSYYVQGETSPTCAGFPTIVRPASFDFATATRHLELFNVKHFIARSSLANQALATMKEWRLVARESEWALYELMTHEGRHVFIPPRLPYCVETSRWKECSLEWLYTPRALDQFLLWKMPGTEIQGNGLVTLSESQALEGLRALRQTNSPGPLVSGPVLSEAGTGRISHEIVEEGRIRFRTTALGLPHIIKVTWFPNWKVRGARQVYCISPGFLCVFPDQQEVELYYGSTWSDVVGYVLTVLGCCGVAAWILVGRKIGNLPGEPVKSTEKENVCC